MLNADNFENENMDVLAREVIGHLPPLIASGLCTMSRIEMALLFESMKKHMAVINQRTKFEVQMLKERRFRWDHAELYTRAKRVDTGRRERNKQKRATLAVEPDTMTQ